MNFIFYIIITIFNILYCSFNYSFSFNYLLTFMIIEFISVYVIRKNTFKLNLKKILLSILLTAVTIVFIPNNIIYGYKNIKINITNLDTNLSIYLDGEKQKIGVLNDELLTDFNITNKLTSEYYVSTDYTFNTNYAKKVVMSFEKKDVEQMINIDDTEIIIPKKETYENFYLDELNKFYFEYEINNLSNFNLFLSVFSFLYLFVMFYFIISSKKIKKILLLTCLLCFEFSSVTNFNLINKLILSIFLFFLSLIVKEKKFNLVKNDILIFIVSLISTFCFSGTIILGTLNKSVVFFEILLYLINFIFLYYIFYKLNDIVFIKENIYKKRHKFIIFFIIFGILIFYKQMIGDCFVHPDGYMQLGQIDGTRVISNWHPLMHTLFIKYLNIIFNSISGFVYFRIIIVSLMLTSILNYWYKKGINVKLTYLLAIFFSIFPVNIVYVMTLTKDVDFAIALIYITFLISRLVLDRKLSILNYIYLFICLAAILYFRHNGIVAFIGIFLLLFVYFIKKKNILNIILTIASCVLIVGISYLVNNSYKEMKKYDTFAYAPLAHGLDYLYVNNLLSENDKSYLNTIISQNTWLNGYDKYNIDILIHYGQNSFIGSEFDKFSFFVTYIDNLYKYPFYMIKDRLYGIDLMWNVFGHDNNPVYRYHLIYDQYGDNWVKDYALKRNDNFITNKLHSILLFLGSNDVADFIFFRGGIYFVLINIFMFYILWIKKYSLLIIFTPCLFNNISLFLAMHHQSYRYVLYLPFIFIICLFSTIISKKTS